MITLILVIAGMLIVTFFLIIVLRPRREESLQEKLYENLFKRNLSSQVYGDKWNG